MATRTQIDPGKVIKKKPEAPSITKALPQRAVFLKPIFRYKLPDREEESGQVILILANIKPAAMALTPITDCANTGKNILGAIVVMPIVMVAKFAYRRTRLDQTQRGKISSSDLLSIRMVT